MPAEELVHEERTVVVIATGAAGPRLSERLPAGAEIVAADGGVDAALALGLDVAVAVGDFDSVSAEGLAAVERRGAQIERHPTEKDATDLELALDAALARGAKRVVVAGADGGRLDHLLAELLLLGEDRYAGVEIDALLGPSTAHVVRGERLLVGDPGELVSLFALHGPAQGVTTEGLAYPLRGETLVPGSSRGVSNVFSARDARIAVAHGVVLALRPGIVEGRST
jgi:thiamine pyrophosphokinase